MYSIFIYLYKLGFKIAALFYPKASKRNLGLRLQSKELDFQLNKISTERILVHCASLGEYEQVKPIVQWIIDHTDYGVVVSFFSPSGYEDCELINDRTIKCYLPFDVKSDQEKFISTINPSKIIITKNEWWWNLLQAIKERQIPTYLVSSTIRSDHYFIKNPWLFFKERIAGDTRKDRVQSIKTKADLSDNQDTVIYGSIWQSDLHIIKEIIKSLPNHNHLIYPHDLSDGNIEKLSKELSCKVVDRIPNQLDGDIVIINSMGQLKSDYAKATLSYVGGGFGEGIHNVLEASVYEVPVIVGPRWQKSEEAKELIQLGAIFPISDIAQTDSTIEQLKSKEVRKEIKLKLKSYFSASQSATELICKNIFQ